MLLNTTKKELRIVSLKTEVNHFFLRLRLFGVESSETSRLVSHTNSLHVVDIIYILHVQRVESNIPDSPLDMTGKPRSVKSPVAEGRDRHNIQGLSFYDPRRQHF